MEVTFDEPTTRRLTSFTRPNCNTFDGQILGYDFIPRKNFGSYDIAQPGVVRGTRFGDLAGLKRDCDTNPACKGWNSFGDLKSDIVQPLTSSSWHVWSGFSACEVSALFPIYHHVVSQGDRIISNDSHTHIKTTGILH